MVSFFGDYDTTETINIPFNAFSSDDPSASVTITNLVAGDVEIHKDGGLTQRASDAGVTVSIDFDGVTGNHLISIDLSDNTDAGFYAAGSRYQVRIEGTTVDGATINAWIGAFSIGCVLRPSTDGRTLGVEADGDLTKVNTLDGHTAQTADNDTKLTTIAGDVVNLDGAAMRGTDSAYTGTPPTVAQIQAELEENGASILDTLRDDLADGGRLDLLVDAIKAKTDNLPADPASETNVDANETKIDTLLSRVTAAVALASIVTEARMSELDAATAGKMANQVDEIRTDTENLQSRTPAALVGGRTDADVGAKTGNVPLSVQEKADVNAEVVDVLTVDTHAEPGQGAPSATATIVYKLGLLYKWLTNEKDNDGTTVQLKNAAGTTVDQKRTVSEVDDVVTEDEMVSGP